MSTASWKNADRMHHDKAGSAPPDASAQPSILIVDDDPFMLGLQARMLQSMGYQQVAIAGSAQEALADLLSGRQSAQIILCDLNMPGMDGVEFLQALNTGHFEGSVILLSGEGARVMHTVQKLLSGGRLTVLGGLEKPAHPDVLRGLMDCWIPPGRAATAPRPGWPITPQDIRAANAQGQWLLHYQPKVSLSTGALNGMEALVRWMHPQHGLVFPDSFIDLAEDCGEIDTLTEWVLGAAVDQLARWVHEGLSMQIAVNLSLDNLRAPGFSRRVTDIVRLRGMSPADVTLEITESRAMSPSPAPLESLVRLRLQRFKLSIDDFGTGHSSLAQLRDVPFTELKIDRGFVNGARSNPIIRPMLEGSIGIAKRLGMVSVAEGVETETDFHLLREIECDVAQGYFIGRPMPVEQLPQWMAQWQSRRRHLFGS